MNSKKLTNYNDVNRINTVQDAIEVKAKHLNNLIEDVEVIEAKVNLLEPTAGTSSVDTISERTSGAGVTIDGALIKDATFDTNVAAAGVTLSGTTLAADGTDAAIPITITPKGVANIRSIAGTAAIPTYSFTGDPNTGIYNPGADSIGFCTGGGEKWRISGTDLIPQASNYDIGSTTYPVLRVFVGGAGGGIHPYGAIFGSVGAGTVTANHYGDGKDIVTVLTLTDFVIGPLAGAAAAKVLVSPTPLFTFPAGKHVLMVTSTSLGLTATGTAVTPDVGLGSVAGDGSANATLNIGTAANEDILTGYAIADTVTHAAVDSGPLGATAGMLTGIALNKAADAKTVYLNAAGTWNADNTGNLTATGTVTIKWTIM